MNQHHKIKIGAALCVLSGILWGLAFAAAMTLIACSDSQSDSALLNSSGKTSLQIAMKYAETARFDSLVLLGIGTDTIHKRLESQESVVELELFSALWKFTANLYAGGMLMQTGEAEKMVESGIENYLTIPMRALVGFLDVRIPIELGNPMGIFGGTLSISSQDSSWNYALQLEEPFAYFSTDALPLGKTYQVKIELLNESGSALFSVQDSILLDEQTASKNWIFESLKGSLQITLEVALLDTFTTEGILPVQSIKRAPAANEILVTELYLDGGTTNKYIEIFNGTFDTLQLDHCILGNSSRAITIALPENSNILPFSYAILGADSVQNADIYLDKWTNFPTTKQSLVLHCAGTVLDSLYYTNVKQDSIPETAVLIAKNISTQLQLENWKEKQNPDSWCMAPGTPGAATICEKEQMDDSQENPVIPENETTVESDEKVE